jgi:hypothetical protein
MIVWNRFSRFLENDPAQEHDPKQRKSFPKGPCSNVQRPAAIRRLGVTGTVPVTSEGMDAIRNIKTMAGSPDTDLIRSASRNLAHGFCVFEAGPCLS